MEETDRLDTAILWLRRDLRITDNPALVEALRRADRLLPVFIWSPAEEAPWQPGAASRWWLDGTLRRLDEDLRRLGSRLIIRVADSAQQALASLAEQHSAGIICWNRLYTPHTIRRDKQVKTWARANDIEAISCKGALLVEPWEVATAKGGAYRVFTPFWRSAATHPIADPLAAPSSLPPVPDAIQSTPIDALALKPRIPWDVGLDEAWTPGEATARARLDAFAAAGAESYTEQRDLPDVVGTARLSPHLHFGEISPRQAYAALQRFADEARGAAWLRQIYWREFAHHLLFHFPHTLERPLDGRFRDFPWMTHYDAALEAWQCGKTGIPIVDAGMRELWGTGWMHNRVRMLVASLLTKNLLIPWQAGARWFWDTLVDADLANNTLGWQWVAGCGADAAPYFRIFNPAVQGARFDKHGGYVRRWVPELARLPDEWIHHPWDAHQDVLNRAGIRLGKDYPNPIVQLGESRKRALNIWNDIKQRP
jgi:deoxyribodipyrimidine photo-lyase